MAQNLIDLRRRIKSVRDTQKSTKAMKTVSAAKLRRSVSDINRNKPIVEKIESMLYWVGQKSHQLMEDRTEESRTLIVVISADKGLCGAFNSKLINRAESYLNELKEKDGESPILVTVGNKASKYFTKRAIPIKKNYPYMMSRLKYENAQELSRYLQHLYLQNIEDIKKVEFIFTEFLSASKQEVKIKQIFPLQSQWDKINEENRHIEYIFEPSKEKIFEKLLPRYIDSMIHQLLLQSSASEHAARMIAMDLATKNASEMIRTLTLTMNKMRQAAITKELLEILTATEALKK